ncbi:MAG: hypothetical protein AAGI01_02285 [Myxococcota bacterium]
MSSVAFLFAVVTVLSALFFWIVSRDSRRVTLYDDDLPGFHTYATFKPEAMSQGVWGSEEAPYFSGLCAELNRRGVKLDGVKRLGQARQAAVTMGEVRFVVTLGRAPTKPELWLLTIDQKYRHGLSAPHDTPHVRAFLAIMRDGIAALDVHTVRWHARQNWTRGLIDRWTYKPF